MCESRFVPVLHLQQARRSEGGLSGPCQRAESGGGLSPGVSSLVSSEAGYSNELCLIRSMWNSCSAKPRRNSACSPWGGGKAALTERPPVHMMLGNHPSDEVG